MKTRILSILLLFTWFFQVNAQTDTIPSFDVDTIPSFDIDTIPSIGDDTIPSIGGDTIPPVDIDTIPSIGDTIPPVDIDTIPSIGDTIPPVDIDTIPSIGDTIPPVDIDTIPSIGGDTIPPVDIDTIPSIGGDTIPPVVIDTIPVVVEDTSDIINIENGSVQAYMADNTYYYDTDYETTVIFDYNTTNYCGHKRDMPEGKNIKWTPVADSLAEIKEIRITLSENEAYSDSMTYAPDSLGARSYVIKNLLPKKQYYYKVEEIHADTVVETAHGKFKTVGQVRMIELEGTRNVRDLGGWQTQYGHRIRYGRIYRSGSLDSLTPQAIHVFKENLGVNAELDLRGRKGSPSSPLGEGVAYEKYPIGYYYSGISSLGYAPQARALSWMIARLREGKNVDLHCAIGCDRTGLLSFLIGGVLGMSEVDLCRDYELSTFSDNDRPRSFDAVDDGTFAQCMLYIKSFGQEYDLAQCFYNYLIKVGVTADDIEFLRTEMLGDYKNGGDTEAKKISKRAFAQTPAGIYSIHGSSHSALHKGINIVVEEDGATRKVYCK